MRTKNHFGALIDLWPRLRVPVYATAFTAGLLTAKLASERGSQLIPITIVVPGKPFTVGPFGVEYINVAHSIPEPNAVCPSHALGTVVHSGDWKLDTLRSSARRPTPRAAGDRRGGRARLGLGSTNAMREGRSPSETEVGRE